MWVNKWIKDSSGWCFIGEDGYCVTGNVTVSVSDGESENPGAGRFSFDENARLVEKL